METALESAKALGINAIQIHAAPPQRWNTSPAKKGVEDAFLEQRTGSGVEKVFFHGIYLINLASPNEEFHQRSIASLVHSLDLMHRIGGDGVIFHVGSNKDQPDEETGLRYAAEGVTDVLARSENDARLLLEVAAGSGKIVGDRMEELKYIFDRVKDTSRLGFALDSQHLWASGYDIAGNLEEVISEVEKYFGLDRVWAIHLNDSKSKLGSRIDRHENIGNGEIGLEGIRNFFLHPKLSHIPFILETPAMKGLDAAKDEVAKLRALMK